MNAPGSSEEAEMIRKGASGIGEVGMLKRGPSGGDTPSALVRASRGAYV